MSRFVRSCYLGFRPWNRLGSLDDDAKICLEAVCSLQPRHKTVRYFDDYDSGTEASTSPSLDVNPEAKVGPSCSSGEAGAPTCTVTDGRTEGGTAPSFV